MVADSGQGKSPVAQMIWDRLQELQELVQFLSGQIILMNGSEKGLIDTICQNHGRVLMAYEEMDLFHGSWKINQNQEMSGRLLTLFDGKLLLDNNKKAKNLYCAETHVILQILTQFGPMMSLLKASECGFISRFLISCPTSYLTHEEYTG